MKYLLILSLFLLNLNAFESNGSSMRTFIIKGGIVKYHVKSYYIDSKDRKFYSFKVTRNKELKSGLKIYVKYYNLYAGTISKAIKGQELFPGIYSIEINKNRSKRDRAKIIIENEEETILEKEV